MKQVFEQIELQRSFKAIGDHNPVITQRFGADPYALVYNDRVYLYMTNDCIERNEKGEILENRYSSIHTINVISSNDLVNWTDHGTIYAASATGAATWGNNSWAPAAAWKEIDGKPKFFLYFANSGNGIAVLTSDSPVGPFTDPIQGPLISRKTPDCAEVTWLFDPAVLMDEDGSAYLYFGGGIPSPDKVHDPGTARVVKLGADMISLDGDPQVIANVSYLFEDSGINKINGTYYYSYCSNFNVPEEKAEEIGFHSGEIITMKADNPCGPFTMCGPILKNPEYYFGLDGNNHHCMFQFRDQWYMAYHSRILEQAMGIEKGYRSTNIDLIRFDENGKIIMIEGTTKGVPQVSNLNLYEKTAAATMGIMAGVNTVQYGECSKKCGSGEMVLTDIQNGSWIGLYGVEFGTRHAEELEAQVRITTKTEGEPKLIKICMDSLDGEVLGYLKLDLLKSEEFVEVYTMLERKVDGIHDIYFVFSGSGYEVRTWKFN